jgi:hypothetical protein
MNFSTLIGFNDNRVAIGTVPIVKERSFKMENENKRGFPNGYTR